MEVNKEQAEKCRDIGVTALRQGDLAKAKKFLNKSLQLHALPGVEALLSQASATSSTENNTADSNGGSSSSHQGSNGSARPAAAAAAPTAANTKTGECGREYTPDQVKIVERVLAARQGGRGGHYRVLNITENATDAQIKTAYRKLSLKVHPDKNAAPQASEAFKAVGLAYATLSDTQKRHIYDRYGDEDPDNRSGGGGGGGGGGGPHMRTAHGDVSPEDIFNMFFNGMAGGPGFRVYTSGFGPNGGVHFQNGRPQPRQRQQAGGRPQAQADRTLMQMLFQVLPVLLFALLSFMAQSDGSDSFSGPMPGENKYFSLSHKPPFVNQLKTRLTTVKEIPFFVSDRFLQTYHRNRYQLGQVETMVEKAYEQYLSNECNRQVEHKRKLEQSAKALKDESARTRKLEQAKTYELTRCAELKELFPKRR
ncbi:hypothetical protein MPSEU_000988100 [Mayamaea pseudoterrestris]|nr:hypothetical protein MPSEU_000988100 [Mayamaea pseudoterrestris]